MSTQNKATITIQGKEYTLKGFESQEHIEKVGHYIDSKMTEVSKGTIKLNTALIAILAAVNVADDYIKLDKSVENIREELKVKAGEVEKYKDELNKLKVQHTQVETELAKVKSELEELKKRK